jgi:hypothetical protein
MLLSLKPLNRARGEKKKQMAKQLLKWRRYLC